MKIEFENGSIIETIDGECESTKSSSRHKRCMKSDNALDWLEDYYQEQYSKLPWYKKVVSKIRWSWGKVYANLICFYYKRKKEE